MLNPSERLEFANRLAQQNSALVSLNHIQNGGPAGDDPNVGTLEGLGEMKELIEDIAKSQEDEDNSFSNKSDSVSIFSDASKSENEKYFNDTEKFSSESSEELR